ncbi:MULTISPECIES: pentapeptide repeat-containing protein [Rhodomicrobium]|uniref:pentapeptide repeat-containing protein n=1 Tax=Rhodomicrobium TaxID=1068 RepID=UPI000B4ADBA4|nr:MULTISPECIES: pentapeptide repeat-containing protein [Rhodomicrobium]
MTLIDPTVERIEAGFRELLQEVNATSASTRAGWLFFLGLQAYFFVTLAGIGHRDLLLDKPLTLPILEAQVNLTGFFLFAPLIPLMVHLGVLIQHVQLARQCRELHRRIAIFEGASLFRAHRHRMHLNSYFFTQLIAGGPRGGLFAFFMALIAWQTLGLLPVILLLDFQTSFLPVHNLDVTWPQRAYVVLDVVLLAIFAVYMRYPTASFVSGFGRTIVERPFSFLLAGILMVGAMFFSLSVATIPDEQMDRVMTVLMPAPVPFDDAGAVVGAAAEPRQAFLPTAYLFERGIDPLSGRPLGFFARNLILTDADLVPGGPETGAGEAGANLRRRDLRYATLDRSDMRNADLTGALLTWASLRETNLAGARAEKAVFRGADLWRAKFAVPAGAISSGPVGGIDMRGADLRGANLSEANLQGADLTGALFEGADLRAAQMDPEDAAEATRQGAKF